MKESGEGKGKWREGGEGEEREIEGEKGKIGATLRNKNEK